MGGVVIIMCVLQQDQTTALSSLVPLPQRTGVRLTARTSFSQEKLVMSEANA